MLIPSGNFYGFAQLPVHTQIGKGRKRGIFIRIVIPQCIKKSDHPLLNQIFGFSSCQEHHMCLFQHKSFVFIDQIIFHFCSSGMHLLNQFFVCILLKIFHRFTCQSSVTPSFFAVRFQKPEHLLQLKHSMNQCLPS